jgi:UDP-sulfoquinovose synthase
MTPLRAIVLGADGYLGWPMALRLSALGHDVTAADGFVRRQWDISAGTRSLAFIRPFSRRVEAWP